MATALTSLLKNLTLSDSIHADIDSENHERLLKACNEALKQDKSNVEAQHVRVVALLSLDRFADAVRQFEEGGASLKSRAHLEYGYALYKEGRLGDARQAAEKVESRAGRHLEAQSSYRLEDFVTAQKLYQDLQDNFDNTQEIYNEADLRINSSATEAQLEWQRKGELVTKKKASREDLEAFETAFNAASASLARGELPQAELLLNQARKLCMAHPELSEEDKKIELLPIAVQQLYVFTLLGKNEQAEKIAEELNTDSAPDTSTSKLAQINRIVADRTNFNPYMASRILNATPELPKSDQFFEYQNQVSRQNNFALDFLSGKYSGIESSTAKQLKGQATSTTSGALNAASSANAAAHAQLQLGKAGINAISPLLQKRPYDIGLVATMIQLYLSTNNHGAAVKLIEKLCQQLEQSAAPQDLDVRFAPGLIAIIVSLYNIEGRKRGIRSELAKAASHWRRKSKVQSGLMKAAGHQLIESGSEEDLSEARELFSMLSGVATDRFTAAGLAAGQAAGTSKASTSSDSLPPIEKLIAGIDVDALEAAGVPQPTSTATLLSRKRAADASKPAKKRIRKSRLPKDYDPDKKVDPERWLPIRDRSYYKPKGKKKARNQGQGGAQGAIAAEGDAAATQQSTVQSGGGGGKSKKKNKKR